MHSQDVMTTNVVTVGPDTDVRMIARTLIERSISAVPVVEHAGRIIGIVSEGDLMRRAEAGTERHPSWWRELLAGPEERARDYVKSHGLTAKDVMTREVITVAEDAPLEQIATPRETRVVALGKPSDRDRGSWYVQRYVPHLPAPQEFVLFNRSWYNRAGVERVMGSAPRRSTRSSCRRCSPLSTCS